jgi:Lon protease-like protein
MTVIPLFPLNIVLFPGGPLPLRIFETRYIDMVRRCMRESAPFGVVLIRSGGEVGHADTYGVGTLSCRTDCSDCPASASSASGSRAVAARPTD